MVTRRDKANAIRTLAMDAVEQAQSGHPGMPMGMADIAEVLWSDFIKHNPQDPNWPDRDRFILSNGHGCMLLYALLHLTGYDLTLDDLRQFRQLHSRTPGHPEYGHTPGVETTTGPLGQGLGNAVGMALAEKRLASEFNRDEWHIVDHYTYVFAGDGDLMEGVSHESCALAGTWRLGKLVVFWDNNSISIDGSVSGWFTEDVTQRYQAYDWHVIPHVDAFDPQAIKQAIQQAQNDPRPSLICCDSVIGYGAPNKAGTKDAHGAPLGEEEIQQAKSWLDWPYAPFDIPDRIYQAWDHRQRGTRQQREWQQQFEHYQHHYPELAAEFNRRVQGGLPANWEQITSNHIQKAAQVSKPLATRKSSYQCLNELSAYLPELSGGSADLTGSNCTLWDNASIFSAANPQGHYIYYGVREFGMATALNGQALHGGLIPYGGTFLTFIDYARNALRLAALMAIRSIFVLTHDSIGLGEDGPTHQPVEHIALLRATPNVEVWRPADHMETCVSWHQALANDKGPSCLLLSRQKVSQQQHDEQHIANIARGGYIVLEPEQAPQAIIIATGSEVELAVQAAQTYNQQYDSEVRVVSMPCLERFQAQSLAYQQQVLPPHITSRLVVEAASSLSWQGIAGPHGKIIGLDHYGASAPYQSVYQALGFTVENLTENIYHMMQNLELRS